MTTLTLRAAALTLLAAAPLPAFAQASSNAIATEGDWTVFQAGSPKECWAVSQPKKTVNTRDGKPVEVSRGDIRLYVSYRPGAAGEVSFSGGYPFAGGSTVSLNIGGQAFKLFTEGESAWTGSPADDEKVIAALRGGSEAVLTGKSGKGTQTVDTFSLSGISKATAKAKDACK